METIKKYLYNIVSVIILLLLFTNCKSKKDIVNDNYLRQELKIDSLVLLKDTVVFNFSSEGGELKLYKNKYTNDSIIKGVFYGSIGKSEEQYVFNNQLLSAQRISKQYKEPIGVNSNPVIKETIKEDITTSLETKKELLILFKEYKAIFINKIEKKSFIQFYNTLNNTPLPLKYSFNFIMEKPDFINVPDNLYSLMNLEHLSNYKMTRLPIIQLFKPALLFVYNEAGQSILYLYVFSKDYILLDKLELYYSEEIDEGSISTTFEITKDYKISVKKALLRDSVNGEVIETNINVKNYKINNLGKFEEVK